MILYVSCRESGCTSFKDTLDLLKSFGIEPAIEEDEGGIYFEFVVPQDWSEEKTRKFYRKLYLRNVRIAANKFGFGEMGPTPDLIAQELTEIIIDQVQPAIESITKAAAEIEQLRLALGGYEELMTTEEDAG